MFDWVGHRHYGYIFSAVLTVVCLIFLAMTFIPGAGLGLQFSIAYTGGTEWEVRFEGGTPEQADVRAILEAQGLGDSEVAIIDTDEGDYVRIRTRALALEAPTVTEGSAAAAAAAAASASPSASSAASAAASASASAAVAPPASTAPTSSAAPAAVASAVATAPASPSPTSAASAAPASRRRRRFSGCLIRGRPLGLPIRGAGRRRTHGR